MSWQIPTQIEQDIIAGKATYRTFQTGNGGQSILPVPANAYVVIFGYDFSPAGGGFKELKDEGLGGNFLVQNSIFTRWLETQQISFYTGTDFYPFIHHVNVNTTAVVRKIEPASGDTQLITTIEEIDNSPMARQVYITSSNDVTITHGLINNTTRVTGNAIPVTNRTPQGLTYGGSGQAMNTQTDYGPLGTPLQFMQPSPKDYQDFGFGLLPSNADGQAFATPDLSNGLRDATNLLVGVLGGTQAAMHYFLCIHYALYSKTIPETRG
jgi:hypothetical protein